MMNVVVQRINSCVESCELTASNVGDSSGCSEIEQSLLEGTKREPFFNFIASETLACADVVSQHTA